jgi:hypothetical protein
MPFEVFDPARAFFRSLFTRAASYSKSTLGFTGCGKTPLWRRFVSGHDFSRAARYPTKALGFSP